MKNIIGKKFGELKVISYYGKNKHRDTYWNCVCKCGKKTICASGHLIAGKIKSCGCLRSEKNKERITHGMTNSRFYKIWQGILYRCNTISSPAYQSYGGRGIKCLWKTFEDFRDDMYKSYSKQSKKYGEKFISIDRINNDGNYCKENCSWVSQKEQCKNRRSNKLFTYKGKTMCLADWERKFGFRRAEIHQRIKRGWSFKEAIETKVIHKKIMVALP